eukprot:scaffold38422_cov63-Phaeocystis_antarctica.AAC.2
MDDIYVKYGDSALYLNSMAFKSGPTTLHLGAACTHGDGGAPVFGCAAGTSCSTNSGACTDCVPSCGSCGATRQIDGASQWDKDLGSVVTYCDTKAPPPVPSPSQTCVTNADCTGDGNSCKTGPNPKMCQLPSPPCGTAACNYEVWEAVPNSNGACGAQIMWVFNGGSGSAYWDQFENDIQASCNFVATQASTASECGPCAYASSPPPSMSPPPPSPSPPPPAPSPPPPSFSPPPPSPPPPPPSPSPPPPSPSPPPPSPSPPPPPPPS